MNKRKADRVYECVRVDVCESVGVCKCRCECVCEYRVGCCAMRSDVMMCIKRCRMAMRGLAVDDEETE